VEIFLNLNPLAGYRRKALRFFRVSCLILVLIPFVGGSVWGQTNEELAENLVKENWYQLKNRVKLNKSDSLLLVQAGESTPMARYFFSSLNSIVQKDGFKAIFWSNARLTNGYRIESYLKSFSIHYVPMKTGFLRQKKFLRMGRLVQNIQVVNLRDKRVLWSGDLASAKQDTLTQNQVSDYQKTQISFLRGEMERTEGAFRMYLKLGFLAGVSIAVIVLFFSIRTT